jgi:hypothetical protein
MPRFYFHIRSTRYQLLDEQGKLLEGPREAYAYAQEIIQKIRSDLCRRDDQEQWMMEVCDELGNAERLIKIPGPPDD